MTKPKQSTPLTSIDPMGKHTAGPWHLGEWIRSEKRQPSPESSPTPTPTSTSTPTSTPTSTIDLPRPPWTRTTIRQVQNEILQQILAARTPEATEAAIDYARFLRLSGLDTENYPLFLKILEIENHWVLDALLGDEDPFLLFSTIPPNSYLSYRIFQLLTRRRPGGIYPRTLAIALGALQIAYSSPRDGYKIYPLSIADVDNLGKHLQKDEGQNQPRNRCILDILDLIGSLEGLRWDDSMEQVARQALKIRGNFFDHTKLLEDCIPQALLVSGDYRQDETAPRMVFAS